MKNKYQEALDVINTSDDEKFIKDSRAYFDKYKINPVSVIQELVDKETPVKPIYENDLVDENVVVDTWAYCPTCKEEILYALWGNLNYCPNCGQHLDWSD